MLGGILETSLFCTAPLNMRGFSGSSTFRWEYTGSATFELDTRDNIKAGCLG